MVSAQPPAPQRLSSDTDARIVFRNELTACLALTAPVGMTEESRREWLAVAWNTLKDIPPDILSIGAAEARKTCDHPSKIVPAIVEATKEMMLWRKSASRDARPLRLARPDYITPAQAAQILREFGLKRDSDELTPDEAA